MTYQRHWLLSWGGTLGNVQDIWANNIRFMNRETGSPDSLTDGAMDDLLDDFVSDIRAFHSCANAYINANARVEWVKFNEIGADGRYARQDKTFARFLNLANQTAPLGSIRGASSVGVPPFQSVCVTTTTAVQRGPGSKGRLFLPQCAPPLNADGSITSTAQTNICNAAAAFYTALGNEAGVDLHAVAPHVVSNVGTPGPANRITGVKVGNVVDVISRRKNNIIEGYVTATVSTG